MLSAKDVLLHLARCGFWQLGYEVNFLRTLEVRQMITSVIAQVGFRRGRACFEDDKCVGRLAPALVRHSYDRHLLNGWMSQQGLRLPAAGLLAFARASQCAVEKFGGGAIGVDPIVPAEQVVNFVGAD